MLGERLLAQNRHLVQSAIDDARSELTASLRKQIPQLRGGVLSDSRTDFADALTRRSTTEMVQVVQSAVINACVKSFGQPLCGSLTQRDERIPFGRIYRSESSVSNILRLDFKDPAPEDPKN
jgi:hypothetical protein